MKNKNIFFIKYLSKYITNIFLFLFFIFLINITLKNDLIDEDGSKKYIFSFWEPKQRIPGYLNLCIKTWKKFLPEYEIRILDYKAVRKNLGENFFTCIVDKKMSLAIQSDAIRVAILKKYGGIWFDIDTIITNGKFIKEIENNELVMIGENKMQYIAFIYASKNSTLINEWLKEIINRVYSFNQIIKSPKNIIKNVDWNYLGNGIIDKILYNTTNKKYLRLDKNKTIAFPELKFFENTSLNKIEKYQLFYFQKRKVMKLLNEVKGIILLHNSWTPLKFKNMKEKEFLSEDILLSRLLTQILNKD